jgi:hypothetical protein
MISSPTTLAPAAQEAGSSHAGAGTPPASFRGPRPPDSELRAVRGIAYALVLVLPFWLAIAFAVAVLR